MPGTRGLALAVAAATLASASPARAGDNDLVMSRLGTIIDDGNGTPIDVVGDSQQFRSMVSELGAVMAPRLLNPSDTLGFGGFQFSVDYAFTGITNDAAYWRVLEGSSDPSSSTAVHGDGLMKTVGIFARKGMWFPIPSIEVGAGAVHLADSHLWAAQGYVKFALHEGFHDLPLPSVAARGGASRLMGAQDLDLTVASFDLSLSKHLGVGGTMGLDPYAGWDLLIIIPRSEVVDRTPQLDPLTTPGDENMNFVFRDQADIIRHRLFFGTKVQYYVFALTLEGSLTLAGSSVDDRSGVDVACDDVTDPGDLARCDAHDKATMQESFNVALGLDF
ncbi:MAG TPA: hypothetical protein VL172_23100 [Kofleriaceae bacterium]|nr:hypothetical protein [Kofleriaceae bacterium]